MELWSSCLTNSQTIYSYGYPALTMSKEIQDCLQKTEEKSRDSAESRLEGDDHQNSTGGYSEVEKCWNSTGSWSENGNTGTRLEAGWKTTNLTCCGT
ncbi:hypothetical protein NDU88_004239 [Pleurodeles waltl]|uniref:Uncharacterized protein n=1 Tax=Pleurodeles waltl TaxID=8319 RepID=A0AAV7TRD1_PLEWA|nr:hypothetical protein NDU88_004239 [Pleurodeles waltl]